jgi:hypothetical protein
MSMLMQCVKTKRFIKVNIEEIQAGNKDAPIWVMVDNEEDATNDPGWIGNDHTIVMLQFVTENYGCTEGLSCYTPQSELDDIQRKREEKEAQDTVFRNRMDNIDSCNVHVIGGGGMRRMVVSRIAALGLRMDDFNDSFANPALDSNIDYLDMMEPTLHGKHLKLPKAKGYIPQRKEMRAINRQFNQRSKGNHR